MSDKQKRIVLDPGAKKRRIRRIILFALIFVLVCGGVLLYVFRDRLPIDTLRRDLRSLGFDVPEPEGKFSFDSNNFNLFAPFGSGLAVVSNSGVTTYDASGKQLSLTQVQMSAPSVRGGDRCLLVFDAGGSRLYSARPNSKTALDLTTEKPVFDADLSRDGYICYATSETGYKTVLNVYNDSRELTYRWLSASTFMPVCAISEKGTYLAAGTLGQRDGEYESSITVFRTDSGAEAQTVFPVGKDYLYDLTFFGADTICAIGESGVYLFGLDGASRGELLYGDSVLKDFSTEGDGFLTLILNTYQAGNHSSIVTVGAAGEELGRVGIEGQLLDLSVSGGYAALLTPEMLTVYDKTLTPVARRENTKGYTHAVQHADGSVILIADGRGELYLP